MQDLSSVFEKCVKAGIEWADRERDASLLEETRKVFLAELTREYLASSSKAAAEVNALAREEYKTHVEGMIEARRLANIAKVKYDQMKNYQENMRDRNATLRAEMKLT